MDYQKLKQEIEALEKQEAKLRHLINKKRSDLYGGSSRKNKDYLCLEFSFVVDGIIQNKKIWWGRRKESTAFNFEQAVSFAAIGEYVFGPSATYLDELIRIYKEKFGVTEKDAEYLDQKWWARRNETFQQMIERVRDDEYSIFGSKGEFYEYLLISAVDGFSSKIREAQEAILYLIFKYYFDADFEKMKSAIENIAPEIKELINKSIKK